MEEIKLLCTADLHLGRFPSRIPDRDEEFSPTFIWNNIVKQTIDSQVDAVIITGDIIDREDCYYEAYGSFEAGIKRLEKEGIVVFAVAGNHDYNLLPRLSRTMNTEFFKLLGAGGKWELESLKKDGQAVLNILGWSYPTRHVDKNPISELELPENGLPTVALLHAELNDSQSNYVSLSKDRLKGTGISAWVLGHIHQADLASTSTPLILNPGSPQPLTPNDQECHSTWELTIKKESEFEVLRLATANLRYMDLEVNLSKVTKLDDLLRIIPQELEKKLEEEIELDWQPKLIILRVKLAGRTEFHREITLKKESLLENLQLTVKGSRVLIESLDNQTQAPIDIEKLAKGNTSLALLAEYILNLEAGELDKLPQKLFTEIEEKLEEAYRSNAYAPLRSQDRIKPLRKKEIAALLKEEGQLLLHSLLAQKEGPN
ncbi:metallophosphoesterase family protein [Fuchsiella alkaliacetigena]|uniref:metallophosphoesterase family protein n=1 Tax=Fuchsiella alkaliacetigena TaxID=957042 RepID=UPI00200B63FB|nr:DNA repair exonuclease [Fuchsiella alkaliacetigena]MCK8825250.1 DNA repair exonuclease [Fuchsiella alkaliacetigena]